MKKEKYDITGMSCAACSSRVEKVISNMDGVASCQVNLLTNSMNIEYDEDKLEETKIIAEIEKAGYGASVHGDKAVKGAANTEKSDRDSQVAHMRFRLVFSWIFLILLMYISMGAMFKLPQPDIFIAENVKGILSLEKGEAIGRIVGDFEGAGYSVEVHSVNLANYGVPQSRQRVFIVGQSLRPRRYSHFVFPEPTHSKRADGGMLPWVTVRDALEHFPDPDVPNGVANHVYSSYRVAFRNFTAHRRTDPEKPCPTILARGNGQGGVCAIPHYNGERRLTVRESAAVQTFPDDFEFVGSMTSCYRQIGNAVPCLFSVRLAEAVGKMRTICG